MNPDNRFITTAPFQGLYRGNGSKAGAVSIALHGGAIALLLLIGTLKPVQMMITTVTPLIAPAPPKTVKLAKSGGGGGARQPLVKKGEAPKTAPRIFTLPTPVQEARATFAPTISVDLPEVASGGVPNGLAGLMAGPGSNGFGGPGQGGLGRGPGKGAGDGDGDGVQGALKIGGEVSAPKPIFTPEPEYSEEARKAKFEGTVRLSIVVDTTGKAVRITIPHPLGFGLDQKAIEAVRRWTFVPAKKDGKPVAVEASVDVSFRLL